EQAAWARDLSRDAAVHPCRRTSGAHRHSRCPRTASQTRYGSPRSPPDARSQSRARTAGPHCSRASSLIEFFKKAKPIHAPAARIGKGPPAGRIIAMSSAAILRHLRSLSVAEHTDRELLRAFALERDESAFAALVRRHGPLVLGVCRRLLGQEQDAEDAFQATFLVLARKAASLPGETIGGWLHGVAWNMAQRVRRATARQPASKAQASVREMQGSAAEASLRELQALLDAEVAGLRQ